MASIRIRDSKADILELTFTGRGEHPGKLRFIMCDCAPADVVAQIRAVDEGNLNRLMQDRMDALVALVQGKNWGVVARINSYTMIGGE